MSNGWIKLHREITKHPVFDNPHVLKLFVYLLCSANRFDRKSVKGNSIVDVKPGQYLTSRDKLSTVLKAAPSTIEDRLSLLEKLDIIRQQKNSNYRLITIVNYESYQGDRQQSRQQTDSNPDTNKKEQERKKDIYSPEFEKFWEVYPRERRGNKQKSFKAYQRALKRADADEIYLGATAYADTNPGEYAKGCEAWLNDDRWTWNYNPQNSNSTYSPGRTVSDEEYNRNVANSI